MLIVQAFQLVAQAGFVHALKERMNLDRLNLSSLGFDFVEAVVVEDALPEGGGLGVALLGEASGPAGLVVLALFLAGLEGVEAGSVHAAGSGLVRAVLLDAVLRGVHGQRGVEAAVQALLVAALGVGALGSVDGGLAALAAEAELPAGGLGAALLLALFEGRQALGVLFALGVLRGALLLEAVLNVRHGNKGSVSCVQAVVINHTRDIFSSIYFLCSIQALFPASQAGVATIVAETQSSDASSVIFAGLLFILAVLLNAILRREERDR